MKSTKVLAFTNIIAPYRIPLYNKISEKGDFQFKVIALAGNEANREWQVMRMSVLMTNETSSGLLAKFRKSVAITIVRRCLHKNSKVRHMHE